MSEEILASEKSKPKPLRKLRKIVVQTFSQASSKNKPKIHERVLVVFQQRCFPFLYLTPNLKMYHISDYKVTKYEPSALQFTKRDIQSWHQVELFVSGAPSLFSMSFFAPQISYSKSSCHLFPYLNLPLKLIHLKFSIFNMFITENLRPVHILILAKGFKTDETPLSRTECLQAMFQCCEIPKIISHSH